MAAKQIQEERLNSARKKANREKIDRLTTVKNVQVSHFSAHVKVQDFQASEGAGQLFGCDRLMKMETMFGRVQLSYNPQRNKSFLFMNLKTSRYDAAASFSNRKIKENFIKFQPNGGLQNKAFTSNKSAGSAVLIEKGDTKPWSETTIKPYLGKVNMEALQKTMPFLSVRDEKVRLGQIAKQRKKLEQSVQENTNQGSYDKNIVLRKEQLENLMESNQLQYIIMKKEEEKKYFFRKINYAYDMQKNEMLKYYNNRRDEIKETSKQEFEEPEEEEE